MIKIILKQYQTMTVSLYAALWFIRINKIYTKNILLYHSYLSTMQTISHYLQMPRKQGLSKRTASARAISQDRQNEGDDAKRRRHESDRQRQKDQRSKETEEETQERLQLDRQRKQEQRSKETEEETQERLQLETQRIRERRRKETELQTQERLQLDRQRQHERRTRNEIRHRQKNSGAALHCNIDEFITPPHVFSVGLRNKKCPKCQALMWEPERLAKSSQKNPMYGLCCLSGKVNIEDIPQPPEELIHLYQNQSPISRHFMKHIRKFNAGMAMASMKADKEPMKGQRGISSYVVQGVVYRRIGPLRNDPNTEPACLQTYFYDDDNQVNIKYEQFFFYI